MNIDLPAKLTFVNILSLFSNSDATIKVWKTKPDRWRQGILVSVVAAAYTLSVRCIRSRTDTFHFVLATNDAFITELADVLFILQGYARPWLGQICFLAYSVYL